LKRNGVTDNQDCNMLPAELNGASKKAVTMTLLLFTFAKYRLRYKVFIMAHFVGNLPKRLPIQKSHPTMLQCSVRAFARARNKIKHRK